MQILGTPQIDPPGSAIPPGLGGFRRSQGFFFYRLTVVKDVELALWEYRQDVGSDHAERVRHIALLVLKYPPIRYVLGTL